MSWTKYRLIFRLISPLHIGYRKVGNLQQTRGYVPGKILWAALTARMTRDNYDGSDGQAYVKMGNLLKEKFRFGYLYPSLNTKGTDGRCSYFPWDDDFEYRFLDSYSSTALNYAHLSGEDGSLHETEFIRPKTRPMNEKDNPQQVFLTGDLYIQENNLDRQLSNWLTALEHLQFGGERGYGWGQVELIKPKAGDSGQNDHPDIITCKKNERIMAHTQAVNHNSVSGISGEIEPLVGWERDNTNSENKWHISRDVKICYMPGATVKDEMTFRIADYGVWEINPN